MTYKIKYKPSGTLMKDVKGKAMTWDTKKDAQRFINRNAEKPKNYQSERGAEHPFTINLRDR